MSICSFVRGSGSGQWFGWPLHICEIAKGYLADVLFLKYMYASVRKNLAKHKVNGQSRLLEQAITVT
jgi:hypothetical protein